MVVKTEDGLEFPAEAYLYVPDPDKPSTWKLRIWETPEEKITRAQLGRAAAALGPGFRGQRVELPPEDRRRCARKLISLYRGLDVPDDEIPDYLWRIAGMTSSADDVAEREAVLCVAGDYPDKGLTITEADIDRMVESAQGKDIPIRIEHTPSPLDGFFGKVKRLWRDGRFLKGILEFPHAAWELLVQAGARELSIGITPKMELREVSIVRNPRIAEARIFNADEFELVETYNFEVQEVDNVMNEVEQLKQALAEREQALGDMSKRIAELEFSLRAEQAQREIDGYIADGKLLPAHREIVAALLSTQGDVQFSGETIPVRELVRKFIESLPTSKLTEPKETVGFRDELTEEEKHVAEKLGIDVEQYRKFREEVK